MTSSCQIELDVVTEPREVLHLFKVIVAIVDINDNSPRFEEDSFSIQIPESTASGAAFPLPSAFDADVSEFDIQGFCSTLKSPTSLWKRT